MNLITKLRTFTVLLLILATSSAHAAWVGAFLYRDYLFDHIHVTVSDSNQFDDATELNIWNNAPTVKTSMATELRSASQWILFWTDKSKAEIVDAWTKYHASMVRYDSATGQYVDNRWLTNHNCAEAAEYALDQALGHALKSEWTWSRVFLFIWVPKHHGRIPLGGHVLTRLKDTLKGENRVLYTKKDYEKYPSAQAFLASLKAS